MCPSLPRVLSAPLSWLWDAFPGKPTFDTRDIPDLSGKVIIVTGANTGIGKETARVLLAHGAKVYIAARNQAQSQDAIRQLQAETGNEAVYLKLDLADLKVVKAAAEEFLSKENQLHVLFNNAGVMFPPTGWLTADGYDLQFGTNVLGHYYFTKLLLPTMIATAKTTVDGKVRIVNTSSSAHLFGRLDFDTFKDSPARRRYDSTSLYHQSKFGNVVFALELARRYGDQGIVSTALNPGYIQSNLARHLHLPSFVLSLGGYTVLYDVSFGALTQLYAGTMPEAATLNGKYLVPWARVGQALQEARDPELGEALWDWLDAQVKDR